MAKYDVNPFERSALRDFKLMAGRDEEFKQVRFILRNASKQKTKFRNIMITGDRGVGKTSFLNLIENECEANKLIPIRLNLTENNTKTSNDFFWTLFSQTMEKVLNMGFLEGKGGAIDISIQKILNEENIPDMANWIFSMPIQHKNYRKNPCTILEFDKLIEDIKRIRESIIRSKDERFGDNVKILYLIDEAHNLYSQDTIVQEIRFIIQNQEIGVGFIFAGDNSYQTKGWENVFGGSYREFEIIKLGYFRDPNDVISFFKKSLTSVEFTNSEIEEDLFFRFHRNCLNIYRLTAGKPELINKIACKMFDRLMKGEVKKLNFDKDTQKEVKVMLENSGQLDSVKLDFIDRLPQKYQKWLSKIFASQLYYLEDVHYYGKFHLNKDNSITKDEFRTFCKDLIDRGILSLLVKDNQSSDGVEKDILLVPYIAFESTNDTTKHWLQISSDGFYKFGFIRPQKLFFMDINNNLCPDINAGSYLLALRCKEEFRFSKIISAINNDSYDIENVTFSILEDIYTACKKIIKSSERYALYGKLINHTSEISDYFNAYNYDEKGNLLAYHDSQIAKDKFITSVSSYNDESNNLSLEIYIDQLVRPDIDKFQKQILLTNDKKKHSIIKEDKMSDLLDLYVNKSEKNESIKIGLFFFELFENGYDLNITELNNSSYVLLELGDFEKASQLLNEGERLIDLDIKGNNEIEMTEKSSAVLLLYNCGILKAYHSNYDTALKKFQKSLDYIDQMNVVDAEAGVLKVINIDSNNVLSIGEVISKKSENPLDIKYYIMENIAVLEQHLQQEAARIE